MVLCSFMFHVHSNKGSASSESSLIRPSSWLRHTGETFDEQTLDSSDLMFDALGLVARRGILPENLGQIQLVGLFFGG